VVGVIPTRPEEEEVIGLLRLNRVDIGVAAEGIITEGIITEGIITEGIITEGIITEGIISEGIITEAATGAARGADERAGNGPGHQSNVFPKIIRRRKQATGMIRIMLEGHGTAKLRGASGTIAWWRGATNTLRTETIVTDPTRSGQLIAHGVTLARQTGGASEPIFLRRHREAAVGGDLDRHVVAIQTPLLLAAVGNVIWTTGRKGIS
jgi:hypothetical protein